MGETARAQQMRRVVEEYAASGLGRREFCEQRKIALTTLDYWRRELGGKVQKPTKRPRLVRVEVAGEAGPGFTLRLGNGRSIESAWRFAEAELTRLIRVAESA